ncbi:MAG: hypothetical protein SchgKO_19620 [Schleiferiaceae bacterium]
MNSPTDIKNKNSNLLGKSSKAKTPKNVLGHVAYWVSILLVMILYFGAHWESRTLAFYFSSLLLPIVMGTTYFFNLNLVPKYLLKGQYGKFGLYFFYLLVASLYLEMMVTLLAFVVLADLRVEAIDLRGINIFILGGALYLIVFATSFVRIVLQLQAKEKQVETLEEEKSKNAQTHLIIRSNRKNQQIPLSKITYIESINDYVKVVSTEGEWTTREKISHLSEQLPEDFVRIHRSFVVNSKKVDSFSNTEVQMGETTLTITRTYKAKALEILAAHSKG